MDDTPVLVKLSDFQFPYTCKICSVKNELVFAKIDIVEEPYALICPSCKHLYRLSEEGKTRAEALEYTKELELMQPLEFIEISTAEFIAQHTPQPAPWLILIQIPVGYAVILLIGTLLPDWFYYFFYFAVPLSLGFTLSTFASVKVELEQGGVIAILLSMISYVIENFHQSTAPFVLTAEILAIIVLVLGMFSVLFYSKLVS